MLHYDLMKNKKQLAKTSQIKYINKAALRQDRKITMAEAISRATGKITFINGDELYFNALNELVDIIHNHTASTPEFITVYGSSAEGKKYQLGLDFNMLVETQIDINKIRFSRFQKFLGEILVEKGYLSKEKLYEILADQQQRTHNERLGELLIRQGIVTGEQITAALTEQTSQKK